MSRTRAALLALVGVAVAALCTVAVIPATQAQALADRRGPPATAQPAPGPRTRAPGRTGARAAAAGAGGECGVAIGRRAHRRDQVEGNERIEESTIKSYMLVRDGDPFDPDQIDRSLKTLYATGLFSDVQLNRQGDTLVVHVVENRSSTASPSRATRSSTTTRCAPNCSCGRARCSRRHSPSPTASACSTSMPSAATSRRRSSRRPSSSDQNRVDVVFEINDGANTLVSRIIFVGNHAYSEGTLRASSPRARRLVAVPVDLGQLRSRNG